MVLSGSLFARKRPSSSHLNPFKLFALHSEAAYILAPKLWRKGTEVHYTCGRISPYSGRDCVKLLRSSYMGLYPHTYTPTGDRLVY